jgi:sugar lactone lactonase YvrE
MTRFAFNSFFWVCLLLSGVGTLHGQAITYTGSPVNFGNINVCPEAATTPAPCSKVITLNYKVTAGGQFGTATVLTLGALGGDFHPGSSTCTGNLTAGAACVVPVKFEPRSSGLHLGAVNIVDGSGNVVTTTFIHGVGIGPQITFDGGLPGEVVANQNSTIPWGGVAVDGYGRLFFTNGATPHEAIAPGVYEFWNGKLFSVGTGFNTPQQVAIDGAGTLYVTDAGMGTVTEIPEGCAASTCQRTVAGVFTAPIGIAVDGAGNLYVSDVGPQRVLELPAGCTSSSCEIPIGSAWNYPAAIAVDSAGNVFVMDQGHQRVERVAAGGGGQTTVVSDLRYSGGIAVDAAGDLFVSDFENARIFEVPAGGGAQRTIASGLNQPQGLALDSAGNVFFSQSGSNSGISEIFRGPVPIAKFASTTVGNVSSDSPRTMIIGNGGNTPLSFSRVLWEPNPNFTLETGDGTPPDCASGLSLASGAMCDLSVSFAPTQDGVLSTTVALNDNSLNASLATQMPSFEGVGTPGGPGIDFSGGFTSTAPGVTLNGGATIQGSNLQLTDGGTYEARSAFYPTPIGVSSFTTQFDLQLGGKDFAGTEADGAAFVLQSNGPNALGSAGGGLGYGLPGIGQSGPSITNSIAVKFDLHSDDGEGSSSTGLYINGAAPTTPSINLLPAGINLHSGHTFHVELVYDGSVLTLTITDKSTNAAASYPFTVDIASILGGPTAFAGFTGGTGAQATVANILDWQMTSSACCTAGEPNFTGFTDPSMLSLNSEATLANGDLQMVTDVGIERSSAYFSTAVPVNKFSTDFDFVMSSYPGLTLGEGFTFVVQAAGLNALGFYGDGLGYASIAKSVAVKFDVYSDAGEGSNSTGVYVGGALPTVPATNVLPSGINLHSGHFFHARLNYDGTNLRVSITDLTQYAVFTGTYPVDIPLAVGGDTAYAGFTASTGSGLANETKIFNWTMSSY